MTEREDIPEARPRSGRQTAALAVAGALLLAGAAPRVARVLRRGSTGAPERPADPRLLADPDSEFLHLRGLSVHVKRAGLDGGGRPPLLLMHGFAASVFTWRSVMPTLAEKGLVAAYDRPAFGLTSRPLPGEWDAAAWPQGTPYGPEAQAGLAVALMDELEWRKAVLVGNSMGGAVAALTALRHPDRVAGLVLVDAAILNGGPPSWSRPLLVGPPVGWLGPTMLRAFAPTVGPGLRYLYHDAGLVTPEVVEGYLRPLRLPRAEAALWELARAGGLPRLAADVRRLTVPTLVVGGRDDPLVTPAHERRLAERIPGAELRMIEECGHMPQEERPERFLELLDEFLEGRQAAEA